LSKSGPVPLFLVSSKQGIPLLSSVIDWTAIQAEYERGVSVRALEAKYGVPKSTIHLRAKNQHWTLDTGQHEPLDSPGPLHLRMIRPELPSPKNAIEGANLGIESLVTYMQANRLLMDPTEHSKAAQALTLYNRILINAPAETASQDEGLEDFSNFSDDELAMYAELQERAREKQRGA
jgi:hypothetical protein